MLFQFILNMLIFFQITTSADLLQSLTIAFAHSNHVSVGVIFCCYRNKEKIAFTKRLNHNNVRLLLIDVNKAQEIDYEQILFRNHNHFGVIVDGNCKNSTILINQVADEKKFFFEMYHWLIIANSKEAVLNSLNDASLNINSNVHLAILDNSNKNVTVYDVYNPASHHGGHLMVNTLGYYNEIDGYNAKIIENKYWNRKNMTGVTFKSAVVIPHAVDNLEDYLNSEENMQIDSMHRFQSATVNHCKDMYNFSLVMQRTHSWGYVQANGQFDGLVSLLEKRLVDFGSSPLIYKLDRMPIVDYSYGNWILRSTFIYRRPKLVAKSYEIFLRPLSKNVWITIAIFMSILMLVLRLTFASENYFLEKKQSNIDSSWSFLLLFTLGAFCQQGATCYPKLISSRILSVFVFLFCILIFQFYSASIVSYLLMDTPRTINNLQDLVDSPLRVGIEDILIDRNYFVQTTDPNAIKLYQKKIKGETNDSGFYSPEEGLNLVRQGGFAFHVETSTAYSIIEKTFSNQDICDLEEVQMYRTQPMHANLQKHSPFREMMNFWCLFEYIRHILP